MSERNYLQGSEKWLYEIYCCLVDMGPDPDWHKATCGECGWWIADFERDECRRYDIANLDCKACPAFVRRPQEEGDDGTV